MDDAVKNKKMKTMIDFNKNECNSIKPIAVKGKTIIGVTSKFIEGKLLMFSKFSLKFFVYDLIDVFCFPTKEVRMTYDQYSIEKCHLYLNMTDTDSCSIFFNLICKKECNFKESESRKIIFEILKQSKIAKRLNLSDEFWQQYKMWEETHRKQLGLYEIKNFDNTNICTIAVNPKGYFQKLKKR